MKLFVSLEEILAIGSVVCAILIALGITFGNVNIVEGGAVILSLCSGTVIVKVLKAKKSKLERRSVSN